MSIEELKGYPVIAVRAQRYEQWLVAYEHPTTKKVGLVLYDPELYRCETVVPSDHPTPDTRRPFHECNLTDYAGWYSRAHIRRLWHEITGDPWSIRFQGKRLFCSLVETKTYTHGYEDVWYSGFYQGYPVVSRRVFYDNPYGSPSICNERWLEPKGWISEGRWYDIMR